MMDGKKFKDIIGRIPDTATIVKLCNKYIAWRDGSSHVQVFSFHPEPIESQESVSSNDLNPESL